MQLQSHTMDCLGNDNGWVYSRKHARRGHSAVLRVVKSRGEENSWLACFGVPSNPYTCIVGGVEKFNRITAGDVS